MKTPQEIKIELLDKYNIVRESQGQPTVSHLSRQVELLIQIVHREMRELDDRLSKIESFLVI